MQRSLLPGRLRGALPGAVRFCSLPSRSRATRTTRIIIIISPRKGSNDRSAEGLGPSRERPGSERPASRASVLCPEKENPRQVPRAGEDDFAGAGLSWWPRGHFSVTSGNAPLCSAHRAGNIFLKFLQNTQQVGGEDNGPVGGGRTAGARLRGPQLARCRARQAETLSRDAGLEAGPRRRRRPRGRACVRACVGPSARRAARAPFAAGAAHVPPRPRRSPRGTDAGARPRVAPPAHAGRPPARVSGLGVQSRLPCPGERCSVPEGTRKFENEAGKEVEL